MVRRFFSVPGRFSALRSLAARARLVARLVRDPRVPGWMKAAALVPVLYVLSPIDVVPDLVPVLGQLDDLAFLLVAAEMFLAFCPPDVVQHHRTGILRGLRWSPAPAPANGEVIDAQFRRVD
jgi:uncharacterized membrane protein YkvA (DUF1232 family)